MLTLQKDRHASKAKAKSAASAVKVLEEIVSSEEVTNLDELKAKLQSIEDGRGILASLASEGGYADEVSALETCLGKLLEWSGKAVVSEDSFMGCLAEIGSEMEKYLPILDSQNIGEIAKAFTGAPPVLPQSIGHGFLLHCALAPLKDS